MNQLYHTTYVNIQVNKGTFRLLGDDITSSMKNNKISIFSEGNDNNYKTALAGVCQQRS